MKNTVKLLAIVAIIAVIGFSMIGCKDDPEPAHTHTWDNWIETTLPTCTTAGIKTRTCTVCGAADTQTQEGTAALGHDWNAAKEVISAVSETENGIKAITCKRDKSHTKDEEVNEYATGTAGLEYTLITTGDYANTYGVKKGTFDGAVLHIPAYHRDTADVDYIPVTTISNFGINFGTPNTTLTTVTLAAENQLKSIGDIAFFRCTSLTSINIPEGVTSIGGSAFVFCTSLTSINIPTSVTKIDEGAFDYCTSIASITIPASVTTMDSSVFYDWTAEQTINVPFANADATPSGWNTYWNGGNAVIKYWNGTTWE